MLYDGLRYCPASHGRLTASIAQIRQHNVTTRILTNIRQKSFHTFVNAPPPPTKTVLLLHVRTCTYVLSIVNVLYVHPSLPFCTEGVPLSDKGKYNNFTCFTFKPCCCWSLNFLAAVLMSHTWPAAGGRNSWGSSWRRSACSWFSFTPNPAPLSSSSWSAAAWFSLMEATRRLAISRLGRKVDGRGSPAGGVAAVVLVVSWRRSVSGPDSPPASTTSALAAGRPLFPFSSGGGRSSVQTPAAGGWNSWSRAARPATKSCCKSVSWVDSWSPPLHAGNLQHIGTGNLVFNLFL